MPLGLNSFSFDLFGFSRQPSGRTRQEGVSTAPAASPGRAQDMEPSEQERHESRELSFWGLGFFPVM